MLLQAYTFIFNAHQVAELFTSLGMSTALIIPLGVAKLLAVIAIVSNKSAMLKQLAYAGLGLEILIALGSHLVVGDGHWTLPMTALALVVGSYYFDKKR